MVKQNFLLAIESGIDRAIGVISPGMEGKRRVARMAVDKIRQYAAAKVTNSTGDWMPVNQDVNSLIRNASPKVRARARQLTRDFPYFKRAINILTNYTVGEGIRFQSRVRDANGKIDNKICQKIEDAISWSMEEADTTGKQHFYELSRMAKRQDVETGEYLFVRTLLKDRNRFTPYALQAFEADWLSNAIARPATGNEIDQGIEYDPKTGRVVAYHFAVPSDYSIGVAYKSALAQRIPAEQVIHDYLVERPGQLRGISCFHTAILVAHDLGDYLDAELDGAKMAAKYLAFIYSDNPAGFQAMRGVETSNGRKIESVENAVIEYLNSGEKIELASHSRPGDAFSPFTKFVLRMVSIATDTTYELLTNDYDGISYSNLRGIRNDFKMMMRPHQTRHIRHLDHVYVKDAIYYAVLNGKLDLPGYFNNPRHYERGVFIPPGQESIDPLRESRANIDQITGLLVSPQEIAAERGRDFEEVLNEIQEAKRMATERGLDWDGIYNKQPVVKLSQNPAKEGANTDAKN